MKIKDLIVGQKVTIDLVLGECSIRKTKGNPPRDFLSATLTDGVDTLDGKIWNYNAVMGVPESGKVYTCVGQIGEYQGKKQITLEDMKMSADQDLTQFQPMYTDKYAWYFEQCLQLIDLIENQKLKAITRSVYMSYRSQLEQASSAKGVHHVGIGGNIVHSYEVASLALHIANTLSMHNYPVCTDLCIAGGLLHDIGKAFTYAVDGASIVFTQDGRYMDHIVLGVRMLDNILLHMDASEEVVPTMHDVWAPNNYYRSPEADALRHIICSHHGELEYGSPVVPVFLEAHIVNAADSLSATANTILLANKKAEDEGKPLTDRIYTLHNREYTLQKDVLPNG